MSDLKSSVKSAIAAYLRQQGDTHTPTDALRVIRDQAALMYERQLVFDALDADPMQQLGDFRPQIQRVKNLLDVTSCSRVATIDGNSSIDAVVELRRDEHMNDEVESNVQLTFHYERRPSRAQGNAGSIQSSSYATHIMYWIDLSRDYGGKERLLTIEVWAVGDGPSMGTAKLWDGDEMEAEKEDDGENNKKSESSNSEQSSTDEVEATQALNALTTSDDEQCDRFAAYVDPDILNNFLNWTQLVDLDVGTSIFFLMTFPFYEHEWDLVGFLLEAVFGEAVVEDDGEDMSGEAIEEDEGNIMSDED